MRKIAIGNGFIMFVLFFGIAMVETFRDRDWLMAVFWLLVGCAFMVADNMGKKTGKEEKEH